MQKSRPNANVIRFLEQIAPSPTYLSVLSFGELRKGILQRARKDPPGAQALTHWVHHLEMEYEDRTLGVDRAIARIWGKLAADRSRPVVDTLLAATAIHHGLTLVTRNIRDVQDTPVVLHNPWLPL